MVAGHNIFPRSWELGNYYHMTHRFGASTVWKLSRSPDLLAEVGGRPSVLCSACIFMTIPFCLASSSNLVTWHSASLGSLLTLLQRPPQPVLQEGSTLQISHPSVYRESKCVGEAMLIRILVSAFSSFPCQRQPKEVADWLAVYRRYIPQPLNTPPFAR